MYTVFYMLKFNAKLFLTLVKVIVAAKMKGCQRERKEADFVHNVRNDHEGMLDEIKSI